MDCKDCNVEIPGQLASRAVRNDGVNGNDSMTNLAPTGFLSIGNASLEYKWLAPQAADAPTIVMLHEGLGSVGLWGDFPEKLQQATSAGMFVYSRAGYGQSSKVTLPRPLDYMHREALHVLPKILHAIGFRRGLLLGHSD